MGVRVGEQGPFPQRNMKTLLPGPPRCCRPAPSGARKGLVSGQRGSEVRSGLVGEDTSVLHCPGEIPVTWNPCKPPQRHDHLKKNREGCARLHLLPTGPTVLTGHPPTVSRPTHTSPGETSSRIHGRTQFPPRPPGSTPPVPNRGQRHSRGRPARYHLSPRGPGWLHLLGELPRWNRTECPACLLPISLKPCSAKGRAPPAEVRATSWLQALG